MVKTFLIALIFGFFIIHTDAQNATSQSIDELISKSKDASISVEERLEFANQSVQVAKKTGKDSLILLANRNLSLMYYYTEDFDKYVSINQKNKNLATKLKDTSALAVASFNLGSYYKYDRQNDSAYFYLSKALKYYSSLKNLEQKSYILMSIADLQYNEKDYTSSEANAIEALRILEKLPKTENNLDNFWILYNRIADISSELEQYQKSIEYHEKALEITKKMNDGFLDGVYTTNNLAFVYRQLGNYDKALELYESLLPQRSQYQDDDPTFYALIINNIAYTKLLSGDVEYDKLLEDFYTAYDISEKYDDEVTKMAVTTDLSKLYLQKEQLDSAYKYAQETYKISKSLSSNEYVLDALMVLSKTKTGEEGKAYLYEHIRLSDSLLNIERNHKNKFARIEFETDKITAEKERISQQRMWLMIASAVLLVTLFLLYIIVTQRSKNKELQFEKDQQKANEEIYNLMLSQQDKVDEARANEKKRISQEIHDGILGRLFGTRLSLDSLNFSEGKEAIQNRSNYIKELKTIEEDIRKISHDLNTDFVSGSGFTDIVSELIDKQTKAYQLEYAFDYDDDISWELVSNKDKINIYRIIQEAMQNIYKHAEASKIKISIASKNNVILVSIEDDGKGFDVNKSKKGIGIKNINSRVNELDGTVDFDSEINKGTVITIKVPYKTNP
ncbi:tetratricopeptide repeat protein [Psychroserpens sp. XS_ASV72]|uniref:tetratricopeptide repeat-containing sensor histidine kinase n=1 Tax=Psychroserpens sp. XS_ASV72 TaxID=3241293 RepID=UPI003510E718